MRDEAERDRPSDARAAARDDGNPRWCLHAANGNMTGREDSRHRRGRVSRTAGHRGAARSVRFGGHARHRCRCTGHRGEARRPAGRSARRRRGGRVVRAPSWGATSTSSITWRPCSAGSPRRSSTSACASTSMARAGCSGPPGGAPAAGRVLEHDRRAWRAAARGRPRDADDRARVELRREKAICELLVSEIPGRLRDGVSCRVPTVAIRPGKPNSALSSFVSGIVREPWRVSMPSVPCRSTRLCGSRRRTPRRAISCTPAACRRHRSAGAAR